MKSHLPDVCLASSCAESAQIHPPVQRGMARLPLLITVLLILAVALAGSRFLHDLIGPILPAAWQPSLLLDTVVLLAVAVPLFYLCLLRPLTRSAQQTAIDKHVLLENSERLRSVLDNAFDGIVVIDERGIMQEFNKAAERIFGMTAAEAKGRNVGILMPPGDRALHDGYVAGFLHTGMRKVIGFGREMQGVRKNGELFPIELAITEMNFQGERRFVGTVRDITRRRAAEDALQLASQQLEQRVQERTAELAQVNLALSVEIEERKKIAARLNQLATTESLTGLLNRREFDRILKVEFERAQRYDTPLSLVIFDVDHFKSVNDRFGHQGGDTVLVELAALASSLIRAPDIFARWGGEEFTLLVPGNDVLGALALAEKLRQKIAAHNFSAAQRVTCSFGVADRTGCDTAADLLQRADRQLYRAKEGGRNRVEGSTAAIAA